MNDACRDIRELFDSFLSDELLVETCHEIERHIEDCAECAAELDLRRRLRRELALALDLEPADDATLRRRVEAAIDREPSPSAMRRRWPAAVAAAAALAAVAVGVAWRAQRESTISPRLTSVSAPPASGSYVPAVDRRLDFPDLAMQHDFCALRRHVPRPPDVELARSQLGDYRALLSEIDYAALGYRMVDAHVCPNGQHRLGHLVLEKNGQIVSVFVTEDGLLHDLTESESKPHRPPVETRTVDGFEIERLTRGTETGYVVAQRDRLPRDERATLLVSLDRFLGESERGARLTE